MNKSGYNNTSNLLLNQTLLLMFLIFLTWLIC